jgi:Heterokaryon incompatibility protein (HET)
MVVQWDTLRKSAPPPGPILTSTCDGFSLLYPPFPIICGGRVIDMSVTFTYSPLSQGHIRVLQVCSGGAAYELHHQLLDDELRFRAISYVWGSSAMTQSIICNGEIMPVTNSVFELLSSSVISSLCHELPIWIDAICINQGDNEEKSHQVSQMDSVYSLAEEVILWLGPASSDSDLAMDTLHALSEKKELIGRQNLSQFVKNGELLQRCGLANASEEVRRALGSLLCRSWFQRLWIFQEVVLARQRQVVCGSKIIPWEDFQNATTALARLQVHQFSIIYPDITSGLQGLSAIQEMEAAAVARTYEGRDLKSAFLLAFAQGRAVTDPRDRVYGILGMASSELREKIEVDYSQQDPSALLRLYIECGKAALEEDSSLSLLFLLSGAQKNPGLPSWCPDLNAPQPRSFYMWKGWKSGTSDDPEEEDLPGAWFEPDDDNLNVVGCRVDIVSQVLSSTFRWSDLERDAEIPSVEDSTNNLLWESECLALTRQASTHPDDTPLSYILTLCEGYMTRFEDDPHIMHEAYQRTLSLWQTAKQAHPSDAANQAPPRDTASQRLRTAIHSFHAGLQHNCEGRRFFSTTAGRTGLGPPETQPGDEVYILYGAGPLYLLRCSDIAIQILGNVYIHELMCLDDTPNGVREIDEILTIS